MKRTLCACVLVWLISSATVLAQSTKPAHRTENILFVMTDGLRWQEVFSGIDEAMLRPPDPASRRPDPLRQEYWRDTPEARRQILMPFLWTVVARQGQIFGNQDKQSVARVTNGFNFSYPGYSETLCGFADPRIDHNGTVANPNVTVLEWLNRGEGYRGKVAAFGAWELFPFILNRQRSGLFINAGFEPMEGDVTPTMALLNRLKQESIRLWDEEPIDALTFETALEYFKTKQPRVLFLSLGETDEWGHEGRYDRYLQSARRADASVKTLWEAAQSLPRYKDKTTLIFCTDHGRGDAPDEWRGHGQEIQGSQNIWMALLGPDTAALGERSKCGAVSASQIAATLAALLGEDYNAAAPNAGKPVASVLPGGGRQ